ncbi:unnamed protein product [Angiostrongylus costaricensis]|uniref:Trafficking protein particle complex subunit n=1 Tax=Angiostrongylus costaricensis TaxID=334426 RepID=A0A0R3PLW5_ANGCS|nr:unnamed protein product [Angiostrongylus costaricensis]
MLGDDGTSRRSIIAPVQRRRASTGEQWKSSAWNRNLAKTSAIGAQGVSSDTPLSPAARSSGIEVVETTQFRLSCLQSRTRVKFVVVTSPPSAIPVESLLNKIYELYADYALKNPFYAIDMPIKFLY